MSYDYQKLANTASKLLAKFGRTVEIKRTTGNIVDPVTGQVTAGSTATLSANGIFRSYPDALIDGTRILKGDRELIIDSTVTPLITDKPKINGEYWSIKNITSSNPAGTPLVYFLQVCR